MCPAVSIANGFVNYSPDTTSPFSYATTATYICNDGFFLNVGTARVCIGDGSSVNGSFSGSNPICTRKYTVLVHVEYLCVYSYAFIDMYKLLLHS